MTQLYYLLIISTICHAERSRSIYSQRTVKKKRSFDSAQHDRYSVINSKHT